VGPLAWRGSWCIWNPCSRTLRVRDKAVILPATLRAPSRCFIKPRGALGVKWYFVEPCGAFGAKRCFIKPRGALGVKRYFIEPCAASGAKRYFIKSRAASGAKWCFIEPCTAFEAKRNFVKLCAASGLSGTSIQLVPGSAHTFSATPRRSRRPPRAQAKPLVCRQTFPASAEREAGSMTALSRTRSAREHRFQMHHCPLQARGPT